MAMARKLLPRYNAAFLSKSKNWSYEDEWRLIGTDELKAGAVLKLPIITKIFVGVNVDDDNRHKINEFAKQKNIEVVNCKLHSDRYGLNFI